MEAIREEEKHKAAYKERKILSEKKNLRDDMLRLMMMDPSGMDVLAREF